MRALVFFLCAALAASPAVAERPVVVASKIDTEGALLGNMVLEILAAHGVPTENKLQLGPTNIVRGALLSGQIDVYPEYTGNGAIFFHDPKNPAWKDPERGYRLVASLDRQKNDLVWLAAAPADNTWVIALRRDIAERNHVATVADLARYLKEGGRFKLAASAEFVQSPAALPAFEKTYGFHLAGDRLLILSGGNTAATLRAAAEQTSGVNAAMAYGTDGELSALGLVTLQDDKHAQVVYEPAPVVRGAVLKRLPQLSSLLDPVFKTLTRRRLQGLNAKIAVDGEEAKAVAQAYLKEQHFLK